MKNPILKLAISCSLSFFFYALDASWSNLTGPAQQRLKPYQQNADLSNLIGTTQQRIKQYRQGLSTTQPINIFDEQQLEKLNENLKKNQIALVKKALEKMGKEKLQYNLLLINGSDKPLTVTISKMTDVSPYSEKQHEIELNPGEIQNLYPQTDKTKQIGIRLETGSISRDISQWGSWTVWNAIDLDPLHKKTVILLFETVKSDANRNGWVMKLHRLTYSNYPSANISYEGEEDLR